MGHDKTTIKKTGSTALQGDVTLTGGTNVTLTQSGQDISIAAASGGATGGTPALVFDSSAAAGSATTFIREDDQLALFDATAPSTQAFGDSAAVGTAGKAARRDHKHAMPAAPTTIANDTLWAAKGDIAAATANDTAAVLSAGTQGQELRIDSSASSGLMWANPDVWGAMMPPTGITIGNVDRRKISGVAGTLTSGTLKMELIWLPKNFTVTSITWLSGTTALTLGTSPHSWHALYNASTLALLRQSNDDTAPVWAASSLRTVNLSSTFTTTYAGFYYLGLMVAMTGGTMPTLATASTEIVAVNQLAPATGGNSASTSLGATAPDPAGAITAATVTFYAGVA